MLGSIKQHKRRKHSTTTASLKPELVQKCYKNVEPQYFQVEFEIEILSFDRKKGVNIERQLRLQEQLDEV